MSDDALSLSVSADALRFPPGRHAFHVVFEIRANDVPSVEGARMPLAVALAIDVSGSMQGRPLAHVVASIEKIAHALAPTDQLGVVAFSTRACRVVSLDSLDATQKRLVRGRVGRLTAGGNTNIEDGLRTALTMAESATPSHRRAIVLLSDGQPNVGIAGVGPLRDLAREIRASASVSTLGYGSHHDDDTLAAIADGGGGAYRYIADPALARLQMLQAIGAQADVVAEKIELVIALEPGMRIEAFVGDAHPQFGADGIVVPLPDMVGRGSRIIVARVEGDLDDPKAAGRVLRARLRWRRPTKSTAFETAQAVAVDVGGPTILPAPAAMAHVFLARVDETRHSARLDADRGQFDGAASLLRGLLAEMDVFAAAPAASTIGEVRAVFDEARELVLDEALAMERRPSAEAYAQFRKQAQGVSTCDPSRVRRASAGVASSLELGSIHVPEAYFVVTEGPDVGRRHRIGPSCTLGRTSYADIVVADSSVSRRHAEVFLLEGDFWVADLGSTNTTHVNGRAIGAAPHKLEHADRLRVGGIELRYEQSRRS